MWNLFTSRTLNAFRALMSLTNQNHVCALFEDQNKLIYMVTHRRQGHAPHHPAWSECARGHSTFQHRRRTAKACPPSFRRISVGSKMKGRFRTTWTIRRTLRFWLGISSLEKTRAIDSQINQYLQQWNFCLKHFSSDTHGRRESCWRTFHKIGVSVFICGPPLPSSAAPVDWRC